MLILVSCQTSGSQSLRQSVLLASRRHVGLPHVSGTHLSQCIYTVCRELATELAREVLPQLQGTGTKLLLISIGTPERGREFAAKTGFPEELLLADPESETYAAVGHAVLRALCNAASSIMQSLSTVQCHASQARTHALQQQRQAYRDCSAMSIDICIDVACNLQSTALQPQCSK